ncbi:hypothetical protein ACH4CE_35365 [Streptomyces gelaticus]|uniref:hypothetical protein n=1 Tax=Streptomyces gelaticus TaxID=285446 RepID=UPI0037BAA45F
MLFTSPDHGDACPTPAPERKKVGGIHAPDTAPVCPTKGIRMSSLTLLVLLLLVLVVALVLGALGYLTHHHPALATPMLVVLGGATVLAACIVPIALR